jgi:hypothetical protein
MDAFDHITDSDRSEDGAERAISDGPVRSPLHLLSLMEWFDFERELERVLCPYQPPSVEDFYGY